MSDWTIRDATRADLPALLELWDHLEDAQGRFRVFPLASDARAIVEEQFAEAIDSPDARVAVVEDGGGPIGTATMWHWEGGRHLDPMTVVDLSRVVVDPAHRGRGVGRALIAEAESFGRARGARYLQAHFFAGNEDGRAFWERRGFVPRYEARVRPILGPDG